MRTKNIGSQILCLKGTGPLVELQARSVTARLSCSKKKRAVADRAYNWFRNLSLFDVQRESDQCIVRARSRGHNDELPARACAVRHRNSIIRIRNLSTPD